MAQLTSMADDALHIYGLTCRAKSRIKRKLTAVPVRASRSCAPMTRPDGTTLASEARRRYSHSMDRSLGRSLVHTADASATSVVRVGGYRILHTRHFSADQLLRAVHNDDIAVVRFDVVHVTQVISRAACPRCTT